jgi:hypothetical protein
MSPYCLARTIRQEEELKVIKIGKEEIKPFLLTDEITIYLKDLKKLQDTMNSFSKLAGYKINS